MNLAEKGPPPTKTNMQTEDDQPNSTPNSGGIRSLSPELLARIEAANASSKMEDARDVAVLLGKFPTGRLPAWGIEMAVLFLREKHPVAYNRSRQLLNSMQVSVDDQTFSINGVVQGGVRTLISRVTGLLGVELLEEEHVAMTWNGSAGVLVREELERRAAALKCEQVK